MDWELEMTFFKFGNQVKKLTVANGGLERVDMQTWEIPTYTETLKVGSYDYNLCYIKNGFETLLVKGKLNVNPYK